MAAKRKASDDVPGTSRPPAPRGEARSDDMELSPSANLFSGDSPNDAVRNTRVVVPQPPRYPRAMNVMEAHLMFLQRQERELSVNLRGRAARDYARGLSDGGSAAGEENKMSSPWRFMDLSELTVPQPPADDHPATAAAQTGHSVAEAELAPTTAVRVQICRCWTAPTPWVPFRHICICVHCRHNPSARICCSVCGAGCRRSSIGSP